MTDLHTAIEGPAHNPRGRPTPNVPYLRKMVEWVEEQDALTFDSGEREWNQGTWFRKKVGKWAGVEWCRTTCCVAGHVSLLEGWTPIFDQDGYVESVEKEGEVELVAKVAADALGLDAPQAIRLFNAVNSAPVIRMIAEEIAGERL